jgi:hypothetical protein
MELQHISILKDLMRENISPLKGGITRTLKKKTIVRLANVLNIQNVRMYLSNISGRRMLEQQIIGEADIWKKIDINKIKNDLTFYQNFYFFHIKYMNDNGRFVTTGYLGLYTQKHITDQEVGVLELFSLLYGDYIRKRILLTIQRKTKLQLPHIYEIVHSNGKAGTIITKCQNVFHRSSNCYSSYYMTFDDNYLFVEYIKLGSSGGAFFPKTKKIKISMELATRLKSSKEFSIFESGNIMMKELFSYFKRYDNKISDKFLFLLYPAKNDNQLLGLWIFLFSERQYVNEYELKELINIATPFIKNNYKYIYQRRVGKMIINPIFKNRDTRVDEQKIFVIMPFTLEWSNRIWQKMIKPTIEKKGLVPVRADDLFGQDIMEDIWSGILSARLVIADITNRNPNVFYELGIAHCLGKEVILLTQNKDDIPFDLNRYRHIIYQDNLDGYELLQNRLAVTLDVLIK